jgi:hypothetical protein
MAVEVSSQLRRVEAIYAEVVLEDLCVQKSPSGDIARIPQLENIPFRETWKLCLQLQCNRPKSKAPCLKVSVRFINISLYTRYNCAAFSRDSPYDMYTAPDLRVWWYSHVRLCCDGINSEMWFSGCNSAMVFLRSSVDDITAPWPT